MDSLNVLVVGNSHTAALIRGLAKHSGDGLAHRYEIVNLNTLPNKSEGSKISEEVRRKIAALPADVIVSAIGGNAHNVFGLVRHPEPFDFVIPSLPQLALDEDAELLPYSSIAAIFRRKAELCARIFASLKREFRQPMIHLESPPPVPSEEHLRAYPGVFREKIAELGVAPAHLRYKLWWIMSDAIREACIALDVAYLPVPDFAKDEAGMLLEKFWNNDPTHGNTLYGALMLRHLDEYLGNLQRAGQPA
ncbi:MAG: hypothetical protein HY245_15585 [Rhizobiales bacterium]|nr:hypothetical protein [Hyphomicrobiales bacterium]MBI3674807.1 hypothetical protein [Hyphomicrobiales bacterium]